MKSDVLLKSLLERVKDRIPSGTNMANMLGDILCIGKEAVYRRLRGEVPFSFYEIALVTEKLGISVDGIVGSSTPGHALLHIDLMRFESPREEDHRQYARSLTYLRRLSDYPDAEVGYSAQVIPVPFMIKYRSLAEFRVFMWMYQYEPIDKVKPFHEIDYPRECNDLCQDLVTAHRSIPYAYYIFDSMMFTNLIGQIRYFTGVHLIRPEDRERIKADLLALIDEMETIAARGVFETGKKVQMYISNFNLEATYTYYDAGPDSLSVIKLFSLDSLKTRDAAILDKMKNWIASLKRTSVLISESGEMQRVQYFNRQRDLVEGI